MDIKFKTANDEIVNINNSVLKYKDTKGTVHKYNNDDIASINLSNGILNIKYKDDVEHDFVLQKKDILKVRPFVSNITGIEEVISPTETTNKYNKLIIISAALTAAYLLFSIYVYSSSAKPTDVFEEMGNALAFRLLAPHYIYTVAALVFNVLSYFVNNKFLPLISGVLYIIAMAKHYIYAPFILIQAILMFILFALYLKAEQNQ